MADPTAASGARLPRRHVLLAIVVAGLLAVIVSANLRHLERPAPPTTGPFTLAERLDQIGPAARDRLRSSFEAAGVSYPPPDITLVAFKHEARLDVFATDTDNNPTLITTYPILGTSGRLGPKLREGDRQIPEGFYRLQALNPNSRFHVSIRVDYPNAFDLARAEHDGRTTPGTDIFIHGSDQSAGCLAVGDPVAEELFVLAHDVGLSESELLIAPFDPRGSTAQAPADAPRWMSPIYKRLTDQIRTLPTQ